MLDARTRRLANGIIAVCVLAIVASLAIGLLARRTSGLAFTILFSDAKGLPVGAPVTWRGIRIGEVTRVEMGKDGQTIEVGVSITPQYAGDIPAPDGVTARIKKSLFLPGNHNVALTLHPSAVGRMPSKGAVVQGVDSWVGERRFEMRGAARRAYTAAVEKTSTRVDAVKDWWGRRGDVKEAKKAHQKMMEWLEEIEDLEADAPSARILALLARGRTLAKTLREEGHAQEAELVEDVAASLEELEEASR